MDGLRLASPRLVPEVRLFLADDPTILWARLEASAGRRLPPPYWASAWSGGQAIARFLLDRRETVEDLRVLDLGSGSGLAGIAAALAGAAVVVGNDVDPYAAVAIAANARANGVDVVPLVADLLDCEECLAAGPPADVVLAGDALYDDELADRVVPFLRAAAGRGARVLVGDPGRGRTTTGDWETLVAYRRPMIGEYEDALLSETSVLTPRADRIGGMTS